MKGSEDKKIKRKTAKRKTKEELRRGSAQEYECKDVNTTKQTRENKKTNKTEESRERREKKVEW